MDRRTFIGATGIGVGVTGCLDTNRTDSAGGNGTDNGPESRGSDDVATGSDEGHTGPTESSNDTAGSPDDSSEADAEPEESDDPGDKATKSKRDVAFDSCTRATVTGSFEDGDVALASTGFYDDGLYGNTLLEDGVVFGDDVDAPFSGTVVFEIADDSNVRERPRDGEIVIGIPDYGSDGTVISSLTTRRADYERVTPTHENPHAGNCLSDLEADSADATLEGG
ncbi:hypothetical protein E2L06_08525 [Haloterrigena sp. H1]|uniref:hypothetical protein n=1 Tax=Haloterrigena sp. H1 TaxID=2552943 RepID=UPI00110D7540|nr:hypothetical protein [Haloterrigena sp. H1]TMT79166.1 hypothetical protein E2L06_20365 [Haloterrigena sp. H1]TMT86638.1 hypothetical protein E2L06_08525 [Haloterrigena sp. H1]